MALSGTLDFGMEEFLKNSSYPNNCNNFFCGILWYYLLDGSTIKHRLDGGL